MQHTRFEIVPRAVEQERRRHRRIQVLLVVEVHSDGLSQVARVTELSRLGARLQLVRPAAVESMVTISRAGSALNASVVWCSGTSFGVHFDRPLDENGFLKLRRGV
jgi:hypothetical protein